MFWSRKNISPKKNVCVGVCKRGCCSPEASLLTTSCLEQEDVRQKLPQKCALDDATKTLNKSKHYLRKL